MRLFHIVKPRQLREEEGGGEGGAGGGAGGAGGEGGAEDWRAGLPDELKDNPTLANIKDVNTLAKSLVDTKAMVGGMIRIPGEDASDEARQEFYGKIQEKVPDLILRPDTTNEEAMNNLYGMMGRPEEAAGYEIPDFADFAEEGIELNHDMAEAMKPVAHKYGLSDKQYQGIVRDMTAGSVDGMKQQIAAQQADIDAVKQEWGKAFDEKMAGVDMIRKNFFPHIPEGAQLDAASMKAFDAIATQLNGGGKNMLNDNSGNQPPGVMTPAEAQAVLDEIMNNKAHAYWDKTHPGHQAALAKALELRKLITPGASTDVNSMRSSIGS